MGQPVKYKSSNLEAIKARIRRLPKLVNDAMESQIKKDVSSVIKEYKQGIRKNNFGLERLQPSTIEQKKRKGYQKPNTPLYGKGDANKNSLINALLVKKIKNGYKILKRTAKHHEANLPLNVLLAIHENGALIRQKRGDKTIIIRIPPRPVLDRAIRRYLNKKKKDENAKEVRKAINALVRTGKENEFNKIKGFKEREFMEYGI